MKNTLRVILIAVFVSANYNLLQAQGGAKWSTNGNLASPGDYIGTTNSEPLIISANSSEGLRVTPNGDVKVASLKTGVNLNGLVLTSPNGVLSRLDFSTKGLGNVLFDNGTWGALPAMP